VARGFVEVHNNKSENSNGTTEFQYCSLSRFGDASELISFGPDDFDGFLCWRAGKKTATARFARTVSRKGKMIAL
jgi:hypothetical protein